MAVLWIRIRMDLHDFGILDPHLESAFQMRMRIRKRLLKNWRGNLNY
jgi:hypothetical protein